MVNTPLVNTYNPQYSYNPYYNYNSNNCSGSVSHPNHIIGSAGVSQSPRYDQFSISQQLVNQRYAKQLKEEGNKFRLQGKYDKAIELYKESLKYNPSYTDVLYNLGRTYRDTNKIDLAIKTFIDLLNIDPGDYESRTLLGEFYEEKGSIDSALSTYETVLQYEPNYDYARRNLYAAQVKKVALTNPKRADEIVQKYAKDNLAKALNLIQTSAPDYIKANLQNITIEFGSTEQVNKYENLAQYEHSNNRILISDKLMFANPNVIATYLVHEAVHAGDKDPITSVREEQDAFREMTKFWIGTNNGTIDPDLTLAMRLFNEAPERLDAKVDDLYTKRDPNIRRTSPNHGESSNSGSVLDFLYDRLRAMLPAQGIYNPNNVRGIIPGYPVPYNPFAQAGPNQYVFAQPIAPIYRSMGQQYAIPANYPDTRVVTPDLGLNNATR